MDSVIFDMDGLMIDSEPFHQRAFDYVFRLYGKNLTEEENNKYYVGISDKDAAEDMVKRFELPISAEDLARKKQLAYLKALGQIKAQSGLVDLLRNLTRRGYKKAVASSSTINEIEAVLNALKVKDFFLTYCSAQEVQNGKPAPDLFLLAAKNLKSNPANCLVLEDAPGGITAAKAAGMSSIAIPSKETQDKDFSEASIKLPSLADLAFLV